MEQIKLVSVLEISVQLVPAIVRNNIMVEFCPWLCCDVDVSRSGLTEFLQFKRRRGRGNLISTGFHSSLFLIKVRRAFD